MGCRIRQWRLEDKEALAAIIGNKKVQDNLRDGIPYPYSVKDAEEFISQMLSSDGSEVFAFAIEAEGSLAGSISVYRCANVHHRTGELGYYLGANCWGRGYAAEAVRQVCDHVFENSDILRIFAEPFSRNRASCRVLEKAGFCHEGTLRENAVKNGKLEDMEMYALLRKEWEKGRTAAGDMENCKASAQTPPCPEKPAMPEGYLGGYNRSWWDVAAPNRRLISRYNSMDPEKLWDKYLLLKELLGSVDEKAIIEAPFRCDNGKNIFLGKQFYAPAPFPETGGLNPAFDGLEYIDRPNNVRMPACHHLDVAYTLDKRKRRGSSWVFAVYNVYARRNPSVIYHRQVGGMTVTRAWSLLPFVPSVTWVYTF